METRGVIGLSNSVTAFVSDTALPCPCFPEPYILPDGYSNEDQRYWKLDSAWKNGKPLELIANAGGFVETSARYGEDVEIVNLGEFGIDYGFVIDGNINDIDYDRFITTDEQIGGFFMVVSVRGGGIDGLYRFVGASAFSDDQTLIIVEETIPLNIDGAFLIDSRGVPVKVFDNRIIVLGAGGDECNTMPCIKVIDPVGPICCVTTDSRDITMRDICNPVQDTETLSFNPSSIQLQNECFCIFDKIPKLSRKECVAPKIVLPDPPKCDCAFDK